MEVEPEKFQLLYNVLKIVRDIIDGSTTSSDAGITYHRLTATVVVVGNFHERSPASTAT